MDSVEPIVEFRNKMPESGGDGLDLSGSDIEISGILLKNMSDKGLSIGENSKVRISDVYFESNNLDIAIKDGSQVWIAEDPDHENNYSIAEYVKKPFYGAPDLHRESNMGQ